MHRVAVPQTARIRGFFTREEAVAAGWTERAIRTQLKSGVWRKLAPGRYVEAHIFNALTPPGQHRFTALAAAHGRNRVVRRDSAACVHGLDVARTPRVVSTRHLTEFDPSDVMRVGDTSVTTPAYTVIDCARYLSPREGLVVADSALRQRLASLDDLGQQLAAVPENGKGAGRATLVVSEADARAETAIESISRYEFIAAGLPRAALNSWIGNRRVDFLWERYKVIGEADGIGKYGKTEEQIRTNLRAERLRQRQLEDAGYMFVRWLWDEIWNTPHVVVGRVLRELEKAGYCAS